MEKVSKRMKHLSEIADNPAENRTWYFHV